MYNHINVDLIVNVVTDVNRCNAGLCLCADAGLQAHRGPTLQCRSCGCACECTGEADARHGRSVPRV